MTDDRHQWIFRSATGQERRFGDVRVMSVLPPLATEQRTFQIGSFVPGTDIAVVVAPTGVATHCARDCRLTLS
jgi:hypothetical protein